MPLRNIIFTNDDEYLFASDPYHDRIFVYDASGSIVDIFTDPENLDYPTDIALTTDEKHLLVTNYGSNVISLLAISDGTLTLDNVVFLDPGKNNLIEIKQIGFDLFGNLYVGGKI